MEGGKGGKEGTGISFDVRKLFRSEKVSLMKYSRFANTCHLTLAFFKDRLALGSTKNFGADR